MTGHQDTLSDLEEIVDRAGIAASIERLLPVGVRPRQLKVRTLVFGILWCLFDKRPAHLTRVHQALIGLPETDQWRLGVIVNWRDGCHLLTYRQTERTYRLVVSALDKEHPDGEPAASLQGIVDDLIEASIPPAYKEATRSLAIDWTDTESFGLPPALKAENECADPEASWGHRRGDGPGQKDELFFGYELGLATMVREENGPAVPELARRILLTSCHVDPPPAFIPVIEDLVASGAKLGDVLADSGYSHRIPEHWALPLRMLGANIVTDLHPSDRGMKGTHAGAICCNGNLYCPVTPVSLFELGPLARQAAPEQIAAHDRSSAELARYKLGRISADDEDGHHRVACPAVMGKVRCPLRADSMARSHDHPEILDPPEHAPSCCCQKTITVPPSVNAKTKQKHDYPSKAHRLSYARRSAAERSNATVKDPASNDISRGWCRLMGLCPMTLMLACLFVVRNQRILASFEARQAEDHQRLERGLAPRTRRRRRVTTADLVASSAHAPP